MIEFAWSATFRTSWRCSRSTLSAQLWYRDPQNTSNQTTSLSDAVEHFVGP
jgi:hypothetical protein